ncbi:MAG: sulfite exporter TauE/SafE family protein [Candidatus Nanopelagicaceae bacterium]|nr:sulfite exporter TauE/SafE family protein [Candidatus Nanopelagicaceae bacterium]
MLILEGLILGTFIGSVLGMVGAGGAILAVPGLIAVMGLSTTAATTSSMVIVGAAALSGALRRLKTKNLDIRVGITFSLLGIFGTLLGSQLVDYFSDRALIFTFAFLMFAAAFGMWRHQVSEKEIPRASWPLVVLTASAVGVLTGLLGIGGGFLIVPALVLVLGIKLKLAVGTSLVAITMNSIIALSLRYEYWHLVPWKSIAVFTAMAVIASFVTTPLATHLPTKTLQKSFAILVVIVAIFMIITQGFK